MNILPQPDRVPNKWRDRTQLHHFVACFEQDGVRVLSRWWHKSNGWKYECVPLDVLLFRFDLEKK